VERLTHLLSTLVKVAVWDHGTDANIALLEILVAQGTEIGNAYSVFTPEKRADTR
jgi:hypothetical protein